MTQWIGRNIEYEAMIQQKEGEAQIEKRDLMGLMSMSWLDKLLLKAQE